MNFPSQKFLLYTIACAAAWSVGFGLRSVRNNYLSATAATQRITEERSLTPEATGQSRVASLLAPATPWERCLTLDRLVSLMTAEDWTLAMQTAQKKDRPLAQALLLRWLEADSEAALAFVAKATRNSEFAGFARLQQIAVKYLAATDPERAWQWTGELRKDFCAACRAELLAALCEHDPVAAARLVSRHGHSTAAWGVAFPDMTAASAGPAVKALAAEPDSLLKSRMLLHTMSQWSSKDMEGAMNWWRQQPPQVQSLTLRGLGMGLHILSPTKGSYYSKGSVKLSSADLTTMADIAMTQSTPEDRRDFFARFLIHMSPTDPVSAVEWVAKNLHGQERMERLDSALAYVQPQGALEVVKAWERMPQTGWSDNTFKELASEAAKADPRCALEWSMKLPATQGKQAADAAGYAWGQKDPAAARGMAESLADDSPASAAFAAGVASSLAAMIDGVADPFGPRVPELTPAEFAKSITSVWDWAQTLPGASRTAAAERVLTLWVYADAAGAAQSAMKLADHGSRTAGLRVVTEEFFGKEPAAAMAWARQLLPTDRETVRSVIEKSKLPANRKTEALSGLAVPTENVR